MTKTVKISDDLALLLEDRRKQAGFSSLDDTAEALIVHGLAAEDGDHNAGRAAEELRALIDEADAGGPATPWNPAAAKAEVVRRYAERIRR